MNSHFFSPILKTLFLFLIFTHSLYSCKHIEKSATPEDALVSEMATNKALILAKVISVDEKRDSTDLTSACFKAPCNAFIKIEKIKKKGKLFEMNDDTCKIIYAHFVYTLYPTDETIFQGSKMQLPGLKINDKFEAVIEKRPAPGTSQNYLIYDYKKIE